MPNPPTDRKPRFAVAAALACSLVLAACGGGGDGTGNPDSRLSLEQARAPLPEEAPAELRALRDDANELIPGGVEAFEARLEALRGTPVVVNKWASWCGPCRLEFPFFQAQASARGAEVAFIGVDSDDSDDGAVEFLSRLPLPFPSYSDPDQKIAQAIGAPTNFPSTAYYNSSGERVFVHPGGYFDEADLITDIERWAR